jgi:lysophospholipase L1-like esterase
MISPLATLTYTAALAVTGLPLDMGADSPVKFPAEGALPAKFPPDRSTRETYPTEPDYFMFGTPERSLEQIAAIRAAMPRGSFTASRPDWRRLRRTRAKLMRGGELRILALGDSIVNDTMRSAWIGRLAEAYPKAAIKAAVYVRGGGGCQHYREERRVARFLVPWKPDLILIGGISQAGIEPIRDVLRQVHAALPKAEVLLFTGTFGTADPRVAAELAAAPHSGSGAYGAALKKLADEERCAYLDMTTPWAEYIRSSGVHPHLFYRDVVHANEFGEQILALILEAFFGVRGAPPAR